MAGLRWGRLPEHSRFGDAGALPQRGVSIYSTPQTSGCAGFVKHNVCAGQLHGWNGPAAIAVLPLPAHCCAPAIAMFLKIPPLIVECSGKQDPNKWYLSEMTKAQPAFWYTMHQLFVITPLNSDTPERIQFPLTFSLEMEEDSASVWPWTTILFVRVVRPFS